MNSFPQAPHCLQEASITATFHFLPRSLANPVATSCNPRMLETSAKPLLQKGQQLLDSGCAILISCGWSFGLENTTTSGGWSRNSALNRSSGVFACARESRFSSPGIPRENGFSACRKSRIGLRLFSSPGRTCPPQTYGSSPGSPASSPRFGSSPRSNQSSDD